MKVLLINPDKTVTGGSKSPPIGILYLASYLRKQNIDVDVLDLQVREFNLKKDYDIVGITANTYVINEAHRLAKLIKEKLPNCKIIFGGTHVSSLPEPTLKQDFVDFIARKEGEITLYELVKAIEKRNSFKNIKGISYKENGKIKHNPDREYIKDLDILPFPAYDLVPLNEYDKIQLYESSERGMNIVTSRGCPFNCNFCYKGVFGNCWRARAPEKLIEEIIYYHDKFKAKEIGAQDDVFNCDINRAITLFKLLKKENLDIEWCVPNGMRVDRINYELMGLMKECRCNRVNFGIEHGNQEVLNKCGKGITLQQVRDACKISKTLKYVVKGFFILGNLYETKQSMMDTINFACSLPLDYASFKIATPYVGTRLYDDLLKQGKINPAELNFDEFAHAKFTPKAIFSTENFTKEDVNEMYKLAFRKFYLRPRILMKILFKKSHWKNFGNVFNRAIQELIYVKRK